MAEEHRFQAQQLCANNCGFFGSPTTQNLCSKCYRDLQLKERRSTDAKLALNQTLTPASASASASAAAASSPPAISTAPPAAPSPPAAEGREAAPPAAAGGPSRCAACRRRVGLTGFKCRCGVTFCGSHRYPEQHGCGFDFKAMGREQISKANPVVVAEKLEKI
ncbi:zinc finger A20 and AN1 domain-containing stress-associated protein 3-like [Rhodamnia argentea]|uniref:Zinc finger A20 and AN1 domain-containing stress-associated protein 3-like n=1 Tax=Rhodamnia argentea TaxID=178133 RepID=A0A8B8NJ14_9MYRT|nr:zinc finger A20 and AN1 domain-containing stress-associated protein 3-like [Rhodamnia argentea]XP_048140111.1 zinc finger A20 and AN1 domain-containing stress-associated protein 3-like [Rhodamnia argentea]